MSGYIGSQPADSFLSISSQQITGNGGATYSLSSSVTSPEDIAVFVNNVRQNPNTYSVSSNNLTLGGTIASSDSCYVVFLGKTLATVNPPSGSVGNNQVSASLINSQTAESSANDSDEILIYDNSATALKKQTRANFLTGVGGTNTPNFHAYLNGDQTLPSDSATKINFNAESWDTASAFDISSNYRFTVPNGQAGKYFVYSTIYFESYTLQIQNTKLIFYVNGSSTGRIAGRNSYNTSNLSQSVIHGSRVLNLSVGDYVEVYVEFGASSTRTIAGDGTNGDTSYFGGYKIIE